MSIKNVANQLLRHVLKTECQILSFLLGLEEIKEFNLSLVPGDMLTVS